MRELILQCSGQWADAVADAALDAGALSASVEDAHVDTPQEAPLFGEPGSNDQERKWPECQLTILLGQDLQAQSLVSHLEENLGLDLSGWQERKVPDQDWVRMTQSQFGPIEVTPTLMIVPSWHLDEAKAMDGDPDRVVLQLDPGMAFGTGSHPTTHLCLQWLCDHALAGKTVLDYGCGSGILAIAARRLGASRVWGVDIDAQAVSTTLDNARVNNVQIEAALPDGLPEGTFDVVVANILSSPLKVMAPMLSARVAPGGYMVLSGILEEQAQEVADFYKPWLNLTVWQTLDGWVCLAGQMPQGSAA